VAPIRITVSSEPHVQVARQAARALARTVGLDANAVECVTLAVSELATNLLRYAPGGEIVLDLAEGRRGRGVRIESRDGGPGIADLTLALRDGYSTGGGLGHGLPGVRRLMDDFEIESGPDGTLVRAHKWSA